MNHNFNNRKLIEAERFFRSLWRGNWGQGREYVNKEYHAAQHVPQSNLMFTQEMERARYNFAETKERNN